MNLGISDLIRSWAKEKHVEAARSSGLAGFSIAVRDILNELKDKGLPPGHTPQVCNALRSSKFVRENGLAIVSVDGPPSLQSPTVVVHYRFLESGTAEQKSSADPEATRPASETPEEWAYRLTEKLRGLFKEELAEFGGAEAFMRWVRSDDSEKNDEAAA